MPTLVVGMLAWARMLTQSVSMARGVNYRFIHHARASCTMPTTKVRSAALFLIVAALASQHALAQSPADQQAAAGRAALARIVSGREAAERSEMRRQAAIARQLDLNEYLPWMSGIGPGSYYFGAPYYGPTYPGITASYSAGAFYGRGYEAPRSIDVQAESVAPRGENGATSTGAPLVTGESTSGRLGFVAGNEEFAPAIPSTALYNPLGIGGTGLSGRVNPLFAGLPGWLNAFEPTPYIPGFIFGYPYVGAIEQPLGHRITSAGASGYVYEPIRASDLVQSARQAAIVAFDETQLEAERLEPQPDRGAGARQLPAGGKRYLAEALLAFQQQKYKSALKSLDHLRVETSVYPPAEVLRAQALLAIGDYQQAADVLRDALEMLPEAQWGLLVENYLEYYLLAQPLVRQLRAVEKHAENDPDSADAALLLGYLYGYLGYPIEADEQLQRACELDGDDQVTARLAARFAALAAAQRAPHGERAHPAPPKPEGVDRQPREF